MFCLYMAVDNDFVPQKPLEEYISLGTICSLERVQNVNAPLQSILASNFMRDYKNEFTFVETSLGFTKLLLEFR